MCKIGRSIETEKSMVARGWGWSIGEWGGNCSWVQFLGEMEISGSGCTTVSILKTNEFH